MMPLRALIRVILFYIGVVGFNSDFRYMLYCDNKLIIQIKLGSLLKPIACRWQLLCQQQALRKTGQFFAHHLLMCRSWVKISFDIL